MEKPKLTENPRADVKARVEWLREECNIFFDNSTGRKWINKWINKKITEAFGDI